MKQPKGNPSLSYLNYHLAHIPETKVLFLYIQVLQNLLFLAGSKTKLPIKFNYLAITNMITTQYDKIDSYQYRVEIQKQDPIIPSLVEVLQHQQMLQVNLTTKGTVIAPDLFYLHNRRENALTTVLKLLPLNIRAYRYSDQVMVKEPSEYQKLQEWLNKNCVQLDITHPDIKAAYGYQSGIIHLSSSGLSFW